MNKDTWIECASYRDQVKRELKSTQVDEEEKRKLFEIFNRFQNQKDSSSEDDQQSESSPEWIDQLTEEDILKIHQVKDIFKQTTGIDLESQEDVDLSEKLPASLVQEFEDLLKTENAHKMVEVFTPWWESPEAEGLQLSSSGTALVQELETRNKDLTQSLPKLPETPIPQLQSLTKAQVLSESLRWQLLQA